MAAATEVRLNDSVFFFKRPPGQEELVADARGEWLAGAGTVIGIITKSGERKTKAVPVNDVASVRILPFPDENGPCDVIEAKVGEFTYSMKNWLINLTA